MIVCELVFRSLKGAININFINKIIVIIRTCFVILSKKVICKSIRASFLSHRSNLFPAVLLCSMILLPSGSSTDACCYV